MTTKPPVPAIKTPAELPWMAFGWSEEVTSWLDLGAYRYRWGAITPLPEIANRTDPKEQELTNMAAELRAAFQFYLGDRCPAHWREPKIEFPPAPKAKITRVREALERRVRTDETIQFAETNECLKIIRAIEEAPDE